MLLSEQDLLWGVTAIARYIGRSNRQTYYLLQTNKIPAQKVGVVWMGRRSVIGAALSGEERRGRAKRLAGDVQVDLEDLLQR
jgi:hypothetical protein